MIGLHPIGWGFKSFRLHKKYINLNKKIGGDGKNKVIVATKPLSTTFEIARSQTPLIIPFRCPKNSPRRLVRSRTLGSLLSNVDSNSTGGTNSKGFPYNDLIFISKKYKSTLSLLKLNYESRKVKSNSLF